MMPIQDPRLRLRHQIRARRRAISHTNRRRWASQLALRFAKTLLFRNAQHIAGYLAQDGEMDLKPLFDLADSAGKRLYLPVLDSVDLNRMHFARRRTGQPMRRNRFGIAEPIGVEWRRPERLDVVLLPLVAYDRHGNRLGMGGGFYDRTFAFRRSPDSRSRPLLIGVAFSLQRIERLPVASWDVPLDAILTERGLCMLSRNRMN